MSLKCKHKFKNLIFEDGTKAPLSACVKCGEFRIGMKTITITGTYIDMGFGTLKKVMVESFTVDPTPGYAGRLIYRSDIDQLRYDDGTIFKGVHTVWVEKVVGTLTATAEEQTLVEETEERNLYGYLDMSNLASGDSITIRQYVIIKPGGSYIKVGEKTYSDAQAIPLLEFPESHAKYGQKITLEQVAGVYRTFDYNFFTR